MITTFVHCILYAKGWYEFPEVEEKKDRWKGFARCMEVDYGWLPKTKHEVAEGLLAHVINNYKKEYGDYTNDVFLFYGEVRRNMDLYGYDFDEAVIQWVRDKMFQLDKGLVEWVRPDYERFQRPEHITDKLIEYMFGKA